MQGIKRTALFVLLHLRSLKDSLMNEWQNPNLGKMNNDGTNLELSLKLIHYTDIKFGNDEVFIPI